MNNKGLSPMLQTLHKLLSPKRPQELIYYRGEFSQTFCPHDEFDNECVPFIDIQTVI